ncbi:sugar-binding transcriptional regulator [Tropicimonas sp. IMCC34011]|uniref:sugar-binding transcriptional regulator n=1 Tax=Tropicimonas sp. IMCC34011 TaxID=2248759 RepID=UPI000E22389E|nr:sugar-binding transcriptional regulator [Tropicimonas sp. IMCC34011]
MAKDERTGRSARRLDDAARAAWLYYISGKTQDEIASVLGVSRQSAQRLVSQAMAAGMVKVRIDHPIAACLSLAERLKSELGLTMAEVVPTLPGEGGPLAAVASATSACIEEWLEREEPLVAGFGTGRTLRAAVEQMPRLACAQHKIVSLTGNISIDGSTAYYNVLFSLSDRVDAPTYPLPMPVIASSPEEREMIVGQKAIRRTMDLAGAAEVAFVGIGGVSEVAPLVLDGFLSRQDLDALRAAGAVGEILGRTYDSQGAEIGARAARRVTSMPLSELANGRSVIAAATGTAKLPAIAGAIRGGLITGLITDEATATALLG